MVTFHNKSSRPFWVWRRALRFYLGLWVVVALTACNASTPVKPGAQNVSSSALFAEGEKAFYAWRDNQDVSLVRLEQAEALLGRAAALQPQNAMYQMRHYDALLHLQGLARSYREQSLLDAFNRLHPLVKPDVVTPAFVTYTLAGPDKLTHAERLGLLLRAAEQNPYNPQNWYLLSREYQSQGEPALAAATAQRALAIIPASPGYAYQVGVNMRASIEQGACVYEQLPALRQAARYLLQALASEPNNSAYLTETSRAFLHLGLAPLAYQHAKKAFAAAPNRANAEVFFYSALLLDNPDDMRSATQYLWRNHRETTAVVSALSAWRMGVETIDAALLEADSEAPHGFHAMNLDLLAGMAADEFQQTLAGVDSLDARVLFVRGDYQGSDETFIANAANLCEQSEREFLVAVKHWRNGNASLFYQRLQKLLASGQPMNLPQLWAANILAKRGPVGVGPKTGVTDRARVSKLAER